LSLIQCRRKLQIVVVALFLRHSAENGLQRRSTIATIRQGSATTITSRRSPADA
jgi:hypothetical protein